MVLFNLLLESGGVGQAAEGRIEVYEQEVDMDVDRTGGGCGFCKQFVAAGVYGLVLKGGE